MGLACQPGILKTRQALESVLTRNRFRLGLLGLLLVYLCGWIAPLFENDSAQFAVMAMKMVRESDFLSLIKGNDPYLDKPHLHYWLAALSMKIFGINDLAYRFSALLAAAAAGISVWGLANTLNGRVAARLATWIYLSAQTIVLAHTDVRTDAWLTAFTAFAIWQWAQYRRYGDYRYLLLCALGTGLAFSTKGHIALVVIGSAVLADLAYTRNWNRLFTPAILLAVGVFALTITPVLYAYYHQFDLHPELVIRGRDQRSGVWFILWEQSFERMSGQGIGKNSPDYFFFFHTFLWVFLPWTLYGLMAIYLGIRSQIRHGFRRRKSAEFLTLGCFLIVFPLMSAAQFKLPHYLNILMPVVSVLTASFLVRPGLYKSAFRRKGLMGIAIGIYILILAVVWLICTWVFPLESWWAYAQLILGSLIGGVLAFSRMPAFLHMVQLLLFASIFLNTVLNAHFYPRLLEYQAGSTIANYINDSGLPTDSVYKIGDSYTWAMDFYLQNPLERLGEADLDELPAGSLLYLDREEWDRLRGRPDLKEVYRADHFRITRLSIKFLNPAARHQVLDSRYLVRKE